MKRPAYGRVDTLHSKEYRKGVIEYMKANNWSSSKTAKHFHHAWATIEAWLKEYDEAHRNEMPPIMIPDDSDGAIKWAPEREKCIECIRLQAQLDVYKAIAQQYLSISA